MMKEICQGVQVQLYKQTAQFSAQALFKCPVRGALRKSAQVSLRKPARRSLRALCACWFMQIALILSQLPIVSALRKCMRLPNSPCSVQVALRSWALCKFICADGTVQICCMLVTLRKVSEQVSLHECSAQVAPCKSARRSARVLRASFLLASWGSAREEASCTTCVLRGPSGDRTRNHKTTKAGAQTTRQKRRTGSSSRIVKAPQTTPMPAKFPAQTADRGLIGGLKTVLYSCFWPDHADSRRGSRGCNKKLKHPQLLDIDHADPRKGSQSSAMTAIQRDDSSSTCNLKRRVIRELNPRVEKLLYGNLALLT